MEDGIRKGRAFHLTALALSLALVGCGGGGSDDGVDSVKPGITEGNGNQGSGSQGGETGLGSEVDSIEISNITVLDANGEMTNVVNRNGVTAKVTVKDEAGNPVPSALVTFAGENVTFGSSNSSVITNANGEAVISVLPASNTDTGSYAMSASASYDGLTDTSSNYFYTIQAVSVGLKNLTVAKSELETGASTLVTLSTIDQGTGVFANDVTVNFSATCGSFDSTTVSSSNRGNISTTYKAIDDSGQLCEGSQTISASIPSGTTQPLQTEVNIASISPTSIVYSTAEGKTLGAKSSGSASTSQVAFTIYSNGTPAANQDVEIFLLRAPADFSFIQNGNRTSPQLLTSDASGTVFVTVYPGDIPGPVELKASLKADPTVFALSKKLAVATGRPSQNGVTLAAERRVIQNDAITSTNISAYLTDRQGNYVPEGTVVSFISEGGTVTPSCSTDREGKCSVTFTSQNPRPEYGRVSVIAFTEGDKNYIDEDKDNVYTSGVDILTNNIGTLFRDDNENKVYDQSIGEFQYSRALLGKKKECGDSMFTQPNVPGTCDDALDAVLRQQIVMGFAQSVPTFIQELYNSKNQLITFQMYGNSSKTLPMPSGTTVTLAVEDKTEGNAECKAEIIAGYEAVPSVINLERVYMQNDKLVNEFYDTQQVKNNYDYDQVVKNRAVTRYAIDASGCTSADKIEVNVTAPNSGTVKTRLNQLIPE